ncbi:hypothetical protein RFI_27503 [Reticulomyxa filosa]|uniref:SAM domain-containing protein n=1 Tax=Reticulomyxa filosa TaxID=46433 RepID=X6M7J5_RETFI|nr:hypothetical protein RFI_27503 [Reticulomyxa filosa]|eukprot:ETO09874.1 hypothetical protein RFI_27503 [Reticulomyxa filosa]
MKMDKRSASVLIQLQLKQMGKKKIDITEVKNCLGNDIRRSERRGGECRTTALSVCVWKESESKHSVLCVYVCMCVYVYMQAKKIEDELALKDEDKIEEEKEKEEEKKGQVLSKSRSKSRIEKRNSLTTDDMDSILSKGDKVSFRYDALNDDPWREGTFYSLDENNANQAYVTIDHNNGQWEIISVINDSLHLRKKFARFEPQQTSKKGKAVTSEQEDLIDSIAASPPTSASSTPLAPLSPTRDDISVAYDQMQMQMRAPRLVLESSATELSAGAASDTDIEKSPQVSESEDHDFSLPKTKAKTIATNPNKSASTNTKTNANENKKNTTNKSRRAQTLSPQAKKRPAPATPNPQDFAKSKDKKHGSSQNKQNQNQNQKQSKHLGDHSSDKGANANKKTQHPFNSKSSSIVEDYTAKSPHSPKDETQVTDATEGQQVKPPPQLEKKRVEMWNCKEVARWLYYIQNGKFSSYVKKFMAAQINGKKLLIEYIYIYTYMYILFYTYIFF